MKKFYSLVVFLLTLSFSLNGQTFQVDTLMKSGSILERINLVFMGDGYTATQQDKYITDVNEIIETLFQTPPFKHYKNYFNVFAVKVISLESGANHPKTSPDSDCVPVPAATVNNYFGSTFDYGQIHRLLYPTNMALVMNTLATHFPLYDQGFVIVNTPYYGGAGGAIATCSDNPNGREVAMHEIGHSFAGLADEYWAGPQYAMEKPNMTFQANPTLVKWKNWIGTDGVDIYGHSGNADWKKPHMNCKMGVLNKPLCAVCTETFIEKFHQSVKSLRDYAPRATNLRALLEGGSITFSVDVIKPVPNTLKIVWKKDNLPVAKNVESLTLQASEILTPTSIHVEVTDTTELQRSESHSFTHVYVVQWQIEATGTITGIEPVEKYFRISAFPNPVKDQLNYSFNLLKSEHVNVSLLDLQGKEVKLLLNERLPSGEHQYSVSIEPRLPRGEYMLQYNFGGTLLTRKLTFSN